MNYTQVFEEILNHRDDAMYPIYSRIPTPVRGWLIGLDSLARYTTSGRTDWNAACMRAAMFDYANPDHLPLRLFRVLSLAITYLTDVASTDTIPGLQDISRNLDDAVDVYSQYVQQLESKINSSHEDVGTKEFQQLAAEYSATLSMRDILKLLQEPNITTDTLLEALSRLRFLQNAAMHPQLTLARDERESYRKLFVSGIDAISTVFEPILVK